MKTKYYFFLCLIFISHNLISQNLLQDGNFDNYTVQTYCKHINSFNYIHYAWETQYSNKAKFKKKELELNFPLAWYSCGKWNDCGEEYPPCNAGSSHSPDLLDESALYDLFVRNMNGASGNFVQIGAYELIQQKLDENLETGNYYKVKFRLFVYSEKIIDGNKLKFMLSKNKVKYKSQGKEIKDIFRHIRIENYCDASGEWFEYTDNYKEYQNNHIELLKEYDLTTEVQHDEWIELSFIFEMPDQSSINPLNWFVIDVSEACDGMCSDYAYIDNIELTKHPYCNWEEQPCSPTDGPIHTSYPEQVDNHSNVMVTGLDNVKSATNIKIKDAAEKIIAELDDRYCINGIDTIVWDGLNLAHGVYIWQMTLENDCGEQNYWKGFQYANDNLPIKYFDKACNNSLQTPIPCCESEPDIYIEDETIEGPGELSFHAINNIEVENTTVEANTEKLIMKAGNKITLKPGTHIKEGAYAHIYIEPCSSTNTHQALPPETTYTIPMAEVHDKKLENENTDENATIYPNPCASELHVSMSSDYGKQINIEIFDLNGGLVWQKTINCRFSHCLETISTEHLNPGMYIVELTGNAKTKSYKIVKQ
ncbi:MAG: T9SS type A sorting domain-containing protein [Bacteroidota bacterium]